MKLYEDVRDPVILPVPEENILVMKPKRFKEYTEEAETLAKKKKRAAASHI